MNYTTGPLATNDYTNTIGHYSVLTYITNGETIHEIHPISNGGFVETFISILPIITLLLPIIATVVSLRRFRGVALPLWILLSWVLPIVGPIITVIAATREKSDGNLKNSNSNDWKRLCLLILFWPFILAICFAIIGLLGFGIAHIMNR